MRLIEMVVIALLGLAPWTLTSPVSAQPVAPAGAVGAFTRLSPDNQVIARALFEAQKPPSMFRPRRPFSLDEIAAEKVGGKRWGEVFKEMKHRGLVDQRSLGQVVSAYNLRHTPRPATAGGKAPDDRASPNRAAASLGNDAKPLERENTVGNSVRLRR